MHFWILMKMKNNFKVFDGIFTIIRNTVFPPQCVVCDKTLELNVDDGICKECRRTLKPCINEVCCEKCGKPIVSFGTKQRCYRCLRVTNAYFDKIISAYVYDTRIRDSIVRYKGTGIQSYAKIYAKELKKALEQSYAGLTFDFLCAAPSHGKKTISQGFDNVELICRYLSKEIGIPFKPRVIRKVCKTAKQTTLTFSQRVKNLKNSMTVPDPEITAGKRILLIDDVCTTGATVIECSRALKHAGAKQVHALTLATAVLNNEKGVFEPAFRVATLSGR